MLRIKNRWHRQAKSRSLTEIAQTLGFNCWRIAANAVVELEQEFTTETYSDRLQIVAEYLAFLLQVTDRLIYDQLSADERQQFIPALAHDMVNRFLDNQRDVAGEAAVQPEPFIDLLNQRAADYAEADFTGEDGGFPFLNVFAHHVADAMHAQQWVCEYMIDIGAPKTVQQLRHNLAGLLHFQTPNAE